jgi:hypothetical protein
VGAAGVRLRQRSRVAQGEGQMSQNLRQRLALAAITSKPEPKTLLTGMKYVPAASHADPRAFFERMKAYAEQVRRKP